jgi:hypothetical protein
MPISHRRFPSISFARLSTGLCSATLLFAAAASAHASEGSAQLLTAFQSLCMADPLDYAKNDQKAIEQHFMVSQNMNREPDDSGFYTRSKSYTAAAAVPYELVLNDTHGPKGDFKSCGIRAEADAADFKAELIKTMKLGKPVSETVSGDGFYRHTVWTVGANTLTFSDKSPQKTAQGVRLLLSNKPL